MIKQKLFKELLKIPKGKTTTYKALAIKLKTSPRAIAKMLSTNPNPIKVPCHRVIKSNGEIGGYTFKEKQNPKKKLALLKKEGVKIKENRVISSFWVF